MSPLSLKSIQSSVSCQEPPRKFHNTNYFFMLTHSGIIGGAESLPIVSGSVRTKMPIGQSGCFTGGEMSLSRVHHKSNVACNNLWLECFLGQIVVSGAVGIPLERPLPETRAISS